MKLGGLTAHEDWPKLLSAVKEEVDRAQGVVVAKSGTAPDPEVKFAAGRHSALSDMYDQLLKQGRST